MTQPIWIQAEVDRARVKREQENAADLALVRMDLQTMVRVTGAEPDGDGWCLTKEAGPLVASIRIRIPVCLGFAYWRMMDWLRHGRTGIA